MKLFRFYTLSLSVLIAAMSTVYAQEKVIYDIDLTKGSPGSFATVSGGKFMERGWQVTGPSDQIKFDLNGVVSTGYIIIDMVNVDPHNQLKAMPQPRPGKNQFMGLNECAGSLKIRYRMGTNYPQIKTEIMHEGRSKWMEIQHNNALGSKGWDINATYSYRVDWDSKGFRLSVNGKQFQALPYVPKGFCTIWIGETFFPTSQAIAGPIYKSIKVVSLSGDAAPPPAPSQPSNSLDIPLAEGWNLISIPFNAQGSLPSDVLSSIAGKFDAVYAYQGGAYQTYIPGDQSSNLGSIVAGNGYWIYMNAAGTLNIKGGEPPRAISLAAGWNLVGFNSTTEMPVAQATTNIVGKFDAIYAYDSKAGSYQSYVPGETNTLTTLKPGVGYWIYVDKPIAWDFKLK